MARKITMFELHFDGAQIGPSSVDLPSKAGETSGEDDEKYASETEAEDESRSRPVARLVLASLVVSVAVSLLARRLARRGDTEEAEEGVGIDEVDAVEGPAVQ